MPKNQISTAFIRLERRRRELIRRLLAPQTLVRGSLTRVLQRCGKASCHCVETPSHAAWRLLTSRGGVQRCQFVRQDDVERMRALVAASRAFAQDLRDLEAIQKEQKALLRGLREENDIGYE
jgi:hypothetical protein